MIDTSIEQLNSHQIQEKESTSSNDTQFLNGLKTVDSVKTIEDTSDSSMNKPTKLSIEQPAIANIPLQSTSSAIVTSTTAKSNQLIPLKIETTTQELLTRPVSTTSLELPMNYLNGHDESERNSIELINNKPLPLAPSLTPSQYSNKSRPNSTFLTNQSSLSACTSNSSRPSSSYPTPTSTSATNYNPHSSVGTEELDPTALLIRRLYERLEEQGVPGDGWDEGRERSRDGIINKDEAEGAATVGRSKGKGVANGLMTDEVLENGQISRKEEAVMKRVDRYGFFSDSHPAALASQHHRLAILKAEPFSHLASTSSSSSSTSSFFKRRSTNPSSPRPQSPSSPIPLPPRSATMSLRPSSNSISMALESKRVTKWSEMLIVASRDSGGNTQEWSVNSSWWEGRNSVNNNGKYRKFQRRVFKGVPDRWRRAVWGLEMEKFAREVFENGDTSVLSLEEIIRQYHAYVALPSNQDIQIDLDVPRTISGHVLFHTRYGQGQRALFHVLHAFGLHCEDIGGYCQGMGPIAATFLNYFEPERAYACMVRLFDQYGLRHIFEPGFPGLIEAFYVQERLVELLMPEVHKAFNDHGISTSSYATKWYITLFTNSFPFETQLRLWDGLLLEGIDFLVITSLAIIWGFQNQFTATTATFESILSTLSSYFLIETYSDDAFLRWIRKTIRRNDLRVKMKSWREDWKGFVKDGSSSRRVT